jgi:TRAP-type C4-dicarboxylate transport system permease small subunit
MSSNPDRLSHDSMREAHEHLSAVRSRRMAQPGILIKLQRAALVLTGLAVASLMMVQIVTRYIFDFSIYGIEELMSFFAVWLYFIGSAHGAWSRSHISASLLDVILPFGSLQQSLRVLACAVSTILSLWMAAWAFKYFLNSVQRNLMSLEVGIPIAYVNVIMPVGLALMAVYFFVEFIEELAVLRGKQ